jgi:methylenetetrahydrofolate dehydrogenase (NADP+)/methenyltetrahydrofolate cyclohydrolase
VTRVIDPSDVAGEYRTAVRARVADLDAPLTLVGLLGVDHEPSATYARYIGLACKEVGIAFSLRRTNVSEIAADIDQANRDANVHGVIVFYPVLEADRDNKLRERVAPEKDVEALSSFWTGKLYANVRYLDDAQQKKTIVPCVPLAIVKLLTSAGVMTASRGSMAGRTVAVFNRSDVVGRPLAAMLANDGARVYSFDIDGPLLFEDAAMQETSIERAAALARADVVITGVPSPDFDLVKAAEIKEGAVCLNFSTFTNFADDAREMASVFIPRVGPMTVAMLLRNTVRLYENFRG